MTGGYSTLAEQLAQWLSARNVFTSQHWASLAASPLYLAAIPVLLILFRVGYAQTSGSRGKRKMTYTVKWGRDRLRFALPPPETKLADLRHEIANYTHLPPYSFKLIHAGAVMKDDNAPISAYGLKPGSKLALIGGGEDAPKAAAEKAPRTQASTIAQIQNELEKVRKTLQPDVDSFLVALSPETAAAQVGPTPTSSAPPPQPASAAATRPPLDFTQEHTRLGELLLQSLLRLDAITAEGEWEDARRERKVAVKEVQALLDRLDSQWRARAKG